MATYSSILAWKIPWIEEHGWLQFMGLQRGWYNSVISLSFFLLANFVGVMNVLLEWKSFVCGEVNVVYFTFLTCVYTYRSISYRSLKFSWHLKFLIFWPFYIKSLHIQLSSSSFSLLTYNYYLQLRVLSEILTKDRSSFLFPYLIFLNIFSGRLL